jgi:CRISPR-associated protein Cas1
LVKKVIHIGNPSRLSSKNKQLIIERDNSETFAIPIEDIGIVILENLQVTISNYLLSKILENNVAVIICNEKHLPKGL